MSEHLFLTTPLDDCFCYIHTGILVIYINEIRIFCFLKKVRMGKFPWIKSFLVFSLNRRNLATIKRQSRH